MFGLNFKDPRGFVDVGKIDCSFGASVVILAQCVLKVCIFDFCKCKK